MHATTIARAAPQRQVARRDRQERLVDAVDLDVGDLVDADDRDVDGEAGDQRGQQVAGARRASALGDGDRVQADDRERGADDRVRPREAPQHAERRCDGRRRRHAAVTRGAPRAPARRAASSAAAIGTNAAPAAASRRTNARRRSAARPGASGASRAARRRPARRRRARRRGLTPLTASAYGRALVAVPVGRELGARARRRSPRASIQRAYSSTAREQHPRLGQRARDAVGRAHRADHQRRRRPLASRGRPRRCRAAGRASTRSSRPRRSGRTCRRRTAGSRRRPSTRGQSASAGLARERASWCGLLVEHRHARRRPRAPRSPRW